MSLRWAGMLLAIVAVIPLLGQEGWSQEPVARIHAIADISGKKPRKIEKETDKVRIHRQRSGEWLKANHDSDLFWRDRLLLQKYTRAAIDIRRENQRGEVYVLPNSLETQKEQAVYEIREHPQQLGQVELFITHGSMIVDWAHGKLSVIALGVRTLFSGTRAAFLIDSTRAQGLVYLDHGQVSFPDFPDLQVQKREVYRLRPGQAPVKIAPPVGQAAQLQRFVQVNGHDLWAGLRPWWQKPSFYLPAAAVVTGGVVIAIIAGGGEKVSGKVAVKIPK